MLIRPSKVYPDNVTLVYPDNVTVTPSSIGWNYLTRGLNWWEQVFTGTHSLMPFIFSVRETKLAPS